MTYSSIHQYISPVSITWSSLSLQQLSVKQTPHSIFHKASTIISWHLYWYQSNFINWSKYFDINIDTVAISSIDQNISTLKLIQWGVSKLKCFETKALFLRNKTNFCETKQKNVRWISMKQKFVSQHSNIYHILNAYFLREIISFQGYRAFVEAYDIVQRWWWHRRWRRIWEYGVVLRIYIVPMIY